MAVLVISYSSECCHHVYVRRVITDNGLSFIHQTIPRICSNYIYMLKYSAEKMTAFLTIKNQPRVLVQYIKHTIMYLFV